MVLYCKHSDSDSYVFGSFKTEAHFSTRSLLTKSLPERRAITYKPLVLTVPQKKQNELEAMKEMTAHVDKARRAISYKVKEADTKKEKVLRLKDKQKKRNMALMEGTLNWQCS